MCSYYVLNLYLVCISELKPNRHISCIKNHKFFYTDLIMQPTKQSICPLLMTIISMMIIMTSVQANEQRWQSRETILQTAQDFLNDYTASSHNGRTEIKLGKLDSRLKLKSCDTGLEAFQAPGSRQMGNTTVGVRCPDDNGWSIYVSAKIKVFGQVLVLRQPLTRGTTISEKDLDLVERNLSALPYGYYIDPKPVIGKLTKRTLAANSVLTPQMIQAPKLVKRGQRVTLVGESGPLTVRMVGEALADGGEGDLIRVRADGSKRVIDGTVISQGVIKVTL